MGIDNLTDEFSSMSITPLFIIEFVGIVGLYIVLKMFVGLGAAELLMLVVLGILLQNNLSLNKAALVNKIKEHGASNEQNEEDSTEKEDPKTDQASASAKG